MPPSSRTQQGQLQSQSQTQSRAEARDWEYINTWLVSKFNGEAVPSFERTSETLEALLALAAWNDTADEEKALLAKVRKRALDELSNEQFKEILDDDKSREADNDDILEAVVAQFPPEARQNIAVLAETSLALHNSSNTPSATGLAQSICSLTAMSHLLEQQLARVSSLHETLQTDLAAHRETLAYLNSPSFEPPPALARQTQDWQRGTKALQPKLEEYRERLAALQADGDEEDDPGRPMASKGPAVSVYDVVEREKQVLELRDRVRDVEASVRAFRDLPANKKGAVAELDKARKTLKMLERRRDGLFEGLVEDESVH